MTTPGTETQRKQGLYDPKHEHDACGMGFVVNIKGKQSNKIINQALTVLHNLDHRGATGSESNTGDGAGILIQIPHKFLEHSCEGLGIELPEPGRYGVGMLFLPGERENRLPCEKIVEKVVQEEGQKVIGWRKVPTDNFYLGKTAKESEPSVRQIIIGRSEDIKDDLSFERKLYVIRRRISRAIKESELKYKDFFYINSLSCRTIIYKGMLTPKQLKEYYPDLRDPLMESALALVHSRFSTNTFPSWKLAHPFRYLIHNGEINTLRGNQNWLHAREASLASDLFGDDLEKVLPIIEEDGSDSGKFDNCLEFLTLSGRSLPHAMMMMIPEPWEKHEHMDADRKAFYEYHSCLMEPWDGPASIGFTDGKMVGATLDRNGLRPSRYYVTTDNTVVLASEVGVLDNIPAERVLHKNRLQPGRMLLIDTEEGRIISDEEIKKRVVSEHPYQNWLDDNLISFDDLPNSPDKKFTLTHDEVVQRQKIFGYTYEDLNINVGPMAENMLQPVGAMGNDAPIAVLSNQPQLLYNYFKQLFAQVTNPPIDPIREELITSTETILGSQQNILEPGPDNCRQIRLKEPIIRNEEVRRLRDIELSGFKTEVLPILYDVSKGGDGLEKALDELFAAADKAIEDGVNVLILSDRDFNREKAPIPALLAGSGLHHHLIRSGTRTKVGIVLESGEPREVHHFCLLLGYGVDAINPYMAYESLHDLTREGMLDLDYERAVEGYLKAAVKGIVKVMSKMGISTIKSYRGAQIFEALGIHSKVIDKYFTWTDSRIGGIDLKAIAKEVEMRHSKAFPRAQLNGQVLDEGGQYKWRTNGEYHMYNPKTVHTLQLATKTGDYELYKEYTRLVDEQDDPPATLRNLLELTSENDSVPIEEVEPVEAICKRFKTGAMSYGSISKETHEALAIAMNRIGGKSNTGEGGEDPSRYTPDSNGDSRNSATKQVASGRFGVTSEYLTQGQEIQIKMAQGAKPGEGGELPGRKVYPWIADVRLSTPGVGLISPPPHHDIYSIEDLAQLIHDLKNANKSARINVKLVSEVGVGTVAAGVAKGHADAILISGHDGGTGASPQTSIKHAGLPWEIGLSEVHQTLVLNDLRSRVVLETDGQIKTGRDIAIAALLGAEEYGFGTSALITLGCIMMRVCHLDTCPVGIATQNPELRHKFTGDPEYVVNFMKFIAQDLREIMAQLGFHSIDEMIGRTDKLQQKPIINHWKGRYLDLSPILHRPDVSDKVDTRKMIEQDHALENSLDVQTLTDICEPALSEQKPVKAKLPIKNTNRVVGTIIGSKITRKYGSKGLPEDTIHLKFKGSAGQSFGAFIPKGMTLELEGDANDYFGKGLSGGKLILYPPKGSLFRPSENIIVGNVSFYGATSGEAYIRGMAGERFCVRNSGVHAVVEAVGDHACEYMTGGRVVVLGPTGRNFGAGMSGGIAYVLDEKGTFVDNCNPNMVQLEKLDDEAETKEVKNMIRRHGEYTDSNRAWKVLAKWDEMVNKFVKILPKDYKRMQDAIDEAKSNGHSGEDAVMEAFIQNKKDKARASGN